MDRLSVTKNNQNSQIVRPLPQTFFDTPIHHSRMWVYSKKSFKIVILLFLCSICLTTIAFADTPTPPTMSPEPINLTTLPIATHQTVITAFPTTQAIHEGPWVFSGQVLRGASWETAGPEEWAVVECYCSEDPREVGHLVGSSVTDSRSEYSIPVSEACRFYTLSLVGESATDADSLSGTALPGAHIRFEEPLYGKNLTGNRFFFSTGEVTAPATPIGSPVPAGTRFSPETSLSGFLVILAIGVVGMCAVFVKRGN